MAIAVLFIAITIYIMPTAKNVIAVEKFDKTIEKFDKAVAKYIVAVKKFIKPIEKFDKAVAKFSKPTAKSEMTGDKSLTPTAELKHHTENCGKQTEVQTESAGSLYNSKTQPIMTTLTEYKPTTILDKKTTIT